MARPFRLVDLVPHVVLADRLLHRQALHFLQRRRVVDDQRAVHFPQAGEHVLAVFRELDVGEGLARLGLEFGDDFQRFLVEDLHRVLELLAHHRICPRIAAVFMAAHEKAGATRPDLLDRLPRLHVDDADHTLVEVGRRHDRPPLPLPTDAGTEVGHARQFEIGNLLAHVEIDDLAADRTLGVVARSAHDFVVVLGKVEVVEIIVELGALRIEEAGYELAFAVPEVVDHAGRDFRGLRVVRNLPDFLDVLQRSDEALAR